jgi:small subunit ribosomal protein S18
VRYQDKVRCRFCRAKIKDIDYKDIATLKKLVTAQGKIYSRKRSGNCSHHQKSSQNAMKLARFMGLMPYLS